MQDFDQKQPGYFIKPCFKGTNYKTPIHKNPILDEPEISFSLKRGLMNEDENQENVEKPVVCARCHSLRLYEKVKDPSVENLLPNFDFDHAVELHLKSLLSLVWFASSTLKSHNFIICWWAQVVGCGIICCSVYVTIWTSPLIPLHMGRTENVSTMLEGHFGCQLQPPIGEGRLEELGKWLKGEFHVCGNMWDSSSVDIAASGLGWFAIGLMGEAKLDVWTYDGVVIVCNAILPNRSHDFEVAGFTVSKSVSTADLTSNKQPCYWKTGEVGKGEESRNILVKD
ncbi:hypothetical protein T459_01646 [Capsicum annuum]|uniref:NOA1/YqeH-like C-terminal domain-containing protein n=1 Tax=Capsicum annuum TaxID=4072 RepID=A0A2G3AHR2_CAPAN|nr:hypothetical protein T459_01646 [Capsicum annuum]